MTYSWGRYFKSEQELEPLFWQGQPLPNSSFLPYGNGRSYGDSCLNSDGLLLDSKPLNKLISFDDESGVLMCEAGVLLKDILENFIPKGWFLSVTPGTQLVTVGGAIANDVHGKNHHIDGTFSHFVKSFGLRRNNASELVCSKSENSEYFHATIGGLGLTGVITWAEIQLKKVGSQFITQTSTRMKNVDEFLELSEEALNKNEYIVSWIDCQAKGKSLGQGYFWVGDHLDGDKAAELKEPKGLPLNVPVTPPFSCINKWSISGFNKLYLAKQPQKVLRSKVHYQPFFYPLDGIGHWNRLYGPKGFMQYQCVVPMDNGRESIIELLECISNSKQGSFLTVLKVMGKKNSLGLLSFSREGITLAIDFPYYGEETLSLLKRLDEIVMKAGGAIYPAKDSRMSPEMFKASFPKWKEMEKYKDELITSDFWQRVTK